MTPAACACVRLGLLACEEGLASNCVESMERIMVSRLTHVDPECIEAATSKTAVRLCAGIGAAGCP